MGYLIMRLYVYLGIVTMLTAHCVSKPGPGDVRIIAHRGASAYAPENTIAAFRKAKELGAQWFELDLYLSADGIPVVMHDNTVDRTTNGTGRVSDKTVEELQRLDAGSWFDAAFAGEKIPTLEEALVFAKGTMGIYIEIKDTNSALPEKVLDLLRTHDMEEDVVIQSFSLDQLAATRALHKEIAIEYLTGAYKEIDLQKAVSVSAGSINPSFRDLTGSDVQQIHRLSLRVVPYTVNDPGDMERLLDMGVDGLITDKPDVALRIISNRQD